MKWRPGGAVARSSGGGASGGVLPGAAPEAGHAAVGSGTCSNSGVGGRGRSSKDRTEAGGGDPGRCHPGCWGQPDERPGDDKESHDPAAGPGASRLAAREQALLWDGSDSGAPWGGNGNRGGGGPARGGTGGCYWDGAGQRGAADDVVWSGLGVRNMKLNLTELNNTGG